MNQPASFMDGFICFDADENSKEGRNQDNKISNSNSKLGVWHARRKYNKNNIENRSSQGVEDSGEANKRK